MNATPATMPRKTQQTVSAEQLAAQRRKISARLDRVSQARRNGYRGPLTRAEVAAHASARKGR